MRISFPFLLLLFVSCTACHTDLTTGTDVTEAPVVETATGTDTPAVTDAVSTEVLRLINDVRRSGCRCGNQRMPAVAALILHPRLTAAARTHATDQAGMRRMQHRGSDGSRVGGRLTKTGYRWTAVAENVAWNYPDAEAVVNGWLTSPGHCKNIMSADYQHMGVAVVDRYWSQVFARP